MISINHPPRINICNQHKMGIDELHQHLSFMSANAKNVMGIANAIVFTTMTDALDKLRKLPQYRQTIKRDFEKCRTMWTQYEQSLLHARQNPLFCVADMQPEYRKRFRDDLTDREYFEYWLTLGDKAYKRYINPINALRNKFVIILRRHNAPCIEPIAYALTAERAFFLSATFYKSLIKNMSQESGLNPIVYRDLFSQLSVENIWECWSKALTEISLKLKIPHLEPTDADNRNIELSFEYLKEVTMKDIFNLESMLELVADEEEIFRTKGYQQKTLSSYHKLVADTDNNIRNK